MPAEDGLKVLERGLALKMLTGEPSSANQEAAGKFPDAIKKIFEEKRYLLQQIFNADQSALFWKKSMPLRTFISKESK